MTELSIIIPAYNEAQRLKPSLERILDYLKDSGINDYEIIVVDDGSSDGTSESVGDMVSRKDITIIKNDRNRGKGYSVRRGVMEARGDYILFSDADLSTPIEEYEKLRNALTDEASPADIAIGSRALKGSDIIRHQPIYRELMGKIFNKMARVLTFKKIKDSQCGFKLFRREAAKKLFGLSRVDGFAFDAEIIFLAQKLGFIVKEIPVRWVNSPNSRVNPLKDSAKMFIEVVKIRLWWLEGRYKNL